MSRGPPSIQGSTQLVAAVQATRTVVCLVDVVADKAKSSRDAVVLRTIIASTSYQPGAEKVGRHATTVL